MLFVVVIPSQSLGLHVSPFLYCFGVSHGCDLNQIALFVGMHIRTLTEVQEFHFQSQLVQLAITDFKASALDYGLSQFQLLFIFCPKSQMI